MHHDPIVRISDCSSVHSTKQPQQVSTSNNNHQQTIQMTPSLKSFLNDLETCFRNGQGKVNPEEVKSIFRKYSNEMDINDFEPYCYADTTATYTRNLVMNNPYFSLIVLVWNPQQHSCIHAHGGSQCWFRVLRGQVKECRWLVNPKQDTSLSPVNPTKEFIANMGTIGYIDDSNGVHCIVNMADEISVSLHCYAPPYQECACYSDETGEIFNGKVMFDSIGGQILSAHDTMYNFLRKEKEETSQNQH
nr:unnamed protein product [Naegleria fowleri]